MSNRWGDGAGGVYQTRQESSAPIVAHGKDGASAFIGEMVLELAGVDIEHERSQSGLARSSSGQSDASLDVDRLSCCASRAIRMPYHASGAVHP